MQFRSHFVLLVLASIVGLAPAQNTLNSPGLAGTVHDTSGAVIVGAKITRETQDGQVVTQGVSDSAGNFRVAGVTLGSYTLDVTQPGFREVKQQIAFTSKLRSPLRIVLPVASVKQDVTVVASDSSPQVSTEISQNQSATTVDREDLDRLPV